VLTLTPTSLATERMLLPDLTARTIISRVAAIRLLF
jgi:hypothetical protein